MQNNAVRNISKLVHEPFGSSLASYVRFAHESLESNLSCSQVKYAHYRVVKMTHFEMWVVESETDSKKIHL